MAARARASSKLEQGGSGQTALARVAAIGRWSGEVAVRSVRARGVAEEARAAIAATGCSKAATSRGQRWTRGAASGGAATAEVVREGGGGARWRWQAAAAGGRAEWQRLRCLGVRRAVPGRAQETEEEDEVEKKRKRKEKKRKKKEKKKGNEEK